MYYFIVAAFMIVGPLLSIALEIHDATALSGLALVVKWFAFWAVGVRLSLAGARQILQPAYTARTILGLTGNEVLLVVRELGFANLALGLLGLLSLRVPAAQALVAMAGGVFYGLAGLSHARRSHRNRLEAVAMVSDLVVACILLGASVPLMVR
jgi:hypothetical protein